VTEQAGIEVEPVFEPGELKAQHHDDGRKRLLMLLSITALVCSSLELEVLERLDGMVLYMTLPEIIWDASVALLILLGLGTFWWLGLQLVVRIAGCVPRVSRHSEALFWRLGLSVPLLYFCLAFLNATRLRIYPFWHPGISGWLWMAPTLTLLCTAIVCVTKLTALQSFCRTRLAPIGWLHIVLATISIFALWIHGVRVFHDFAHSGKAIVASDRPPDVYLITIDALRAEDMSLYGYSRPTTPNLERFARSAFTFDYFFANSNFTTSSTISIETGKLPWTHRVFQLGGFLRGQAKQDNVAALLREDGYYTSTISGNSYASPIRHSTQDSYDAVELPLRDDASTAWARYSNLVGLNTLHTLSGPLLTALTGVRSYLTALIWSDRTVGAELILERARDLLERRDIAQPQFVWAHILPPHDPYFAPLPYRGRFLSTDKLNRLYDFIGVQNQGPPPGVSVAELRARYDESICYADHVVGDFLDWLDRTGRLDRSIVIITADHGESFEHQWLMHTGPYLYNGLIRTPLLIHLPGQKEGSHITQTAEQVDILPTILDLIGRQPPNWAEGVSLRPSLEGKKLLQRPIFSMNLETNSAFQPITRGTVAVIDDDFKYIDQLGSREVSLYRYRTDPLEEQNLVESEPVVAERMKALLAEKLREANAKAIPER
jgi:arylsulfatase A-like enzyme